MSQAISYINRIVCFCRISVLFTFFDILCGLDNPVKNLTTRFDQPFFLSYAVNLSDQCRYSSAYKRQY